MCAKVLVMRLYGKKYITLFSCCNIVIYLITKLSMIFLDFYWNNRLNVLIVQYDYYY